jgi:molecular chaperone DnaK
MPAVRDRISTQLGIRVDLDTDPMTAVAFGAAIFAESREWSVQGAKAKSSRKSKATSGPIDIRYDYPARIADKHFRIRVQLGNPKQAKGARLEVQDEAGWTSGQLDLENLSEVRDIPLNKPGENRFKISVSDAYGRPIVEAASEIIVFRTEASAAGMPITHNLAIKVVSSVSGVEKNTLETFVKKGSLLPRRGAETFRASRDLRSSGDGDFLEFEVYEQADGVNEPSLNLPVGRFRLYSNLLEKGDIIRRGDPVIVHWSIDENGLLNCSLAFTEINKIYDAGIYISSEGHKNYDGDIGFRLASESLNGAREDIDSLERALGSDVAEVIPKFRSRLGRQREALELATDADTRRKISEEGRAIRQEISRIRNKPEFVRAVLRSDLDQFVGEFAASVSSMVDPKVNTQIHRLSGLAREALNKSAPHAVDDARRSFDEVRGVLFQALAKQPTFWIGRFEGLAEDRHLAIDKTLHDELVRKGEASIREKDIDSIRAITFRLAKNQVRTADPGGSAALAGLTRD